jgi:ribosomal protein S12 methylthiotransferase
MVGHPGETNDDFIELLEFVKEMRFERLGAFPYSHEEDTYCDKNYTDDIAPQIKIERLNKLMELQEEVALSINELKIGRTLKVIIDSETPDYYIARTEFDSPDVDGEVLISKERKLKVGSFYPALITSATPFDLEATIV